LKNDIKNKPPLPQQPATIASQGPTFKAYIGSQKKTILIVSAISLVCFILLKYLYPYPDFFVDSNNYVDWANRKLAISYRPTAYSYLLGFLRDISTSATFVVTVQYLLFYFSTMFCMLSADYLYSIPRKLMLPLLIAIVANPMLLFQVNMISSDTIFASLTVTWFTLCMWIAKRGNMALIIAQVVALFLCFEIRFMAMFYPLVAIAAIIFSSSKWIHKAAGIGLTIFIILFAIEREKDNVEKATGVRIFSGFSGWQIANNALYCYKYIDIDVTDLPSAEMKVLDGAVKYFIDSVPTVPGDVSSSFIWDKHSPLKQYIIVTSRRTRVPYFTLWFTTSTLYNDYGWYIVKNFPMQFLQYYIIPNTKKYFYPEKEAMHDYCDGILKIPPVTKNWFEFDTDELSCRVPDLQKNVIAVFPALSMLLNLFNLGAIIFFFVRIFPIRKRIPVAVWKFFATWSFFYLSFMAFTIFATAVNLRFLDPIFVLGLIAPFVLIKNAVDLRKTAVA
jgi:hypothetical protein